MRHRRSTRVKVFTRKRRHSRRRNPATKRRGRAHRAAKSHTHWGKVAAHKRRVNPYRKARRSNPRRRHSARRRNPMGLPSVRGILTVKNILRFVSMGAGFMVGNQVNRFLSTGAFFMYAPAATPGWTATISPARPFFGLAQILIGGMFAVKLRNPMLKDAATGIAVAGGVDIMGQVMQLISPATTQGIDVSPGSPMMLGSNSSVLDEALSMMGGMDMPGYAGMGMDAENLYR